MDARGRGRPGSAHPALLKRAADGRRSPIHGSRTFRSRIGRPFSGVIIIDAEHIGLPVGVQAGTGGAPYASHAEDDRSHP